MTATVETLPSPGARPHACSAAAVLQALGSDGRQGLTDAEVAARRAEQGSNELPRPRPVPAWRRFLRQFRDVMVLLLVFAAGVSSWLGEAIDTVAILAIVLLDAGLGFFHESRVQSALAALAALAQPLAHVRRAGRDVVLPARELVPGDVIAIEAGQAVPADARLLAAVAFRTQEAALTGESTPVDKAAEAELPAATALGDRANCLWLGTVAVAGHATAVVTATGMRTELGAIAGMMQQGPEPSTPLQQRLTVVGKLLAASCLVLVAGIAGLHLLRGAPFGEVLVFAIGLAVAAVPEGLPAVVTITLAMGTRRLLLRHALVRKLPCVETLGSVTVICTDKTGTLTRNEMTVREVRTLDAGFAFEGSGYEPKGGIVGLDGGRADDAGLRAVLTTGLRCNTARLLPPAADRPTWTVTGDPTEGALLVAAGKAGLPAALPAGERILWEVPFDSGRRLMSVAIGDDRAGTVHCKGAVEAVLARCTTVLVRGVAGPLTDGARAQIAAHAAAMSRRALRVLALARRELPAGSPPVEDGLQFLGLVGMQDPPRDEVPAAVATCQRAGIRVVMITGDHPDTGLAVAREIGLAGAEQQAVSGAELDAMSDAELQRRLPPCPVFARVSAAHKLRLVQALRQRGEVVAMTGDGINDVPALQAAHLGVAMGRGATDVTRQAADMVLLDDDFASIVAAVREGRGIYDNIRRFVHYLLTANLSEVLLMLWAALAGLPPPLTAAQLLWINLITDGLPALSLAMEPTEPDVMERPPRVPSQAVVSWADGRRILGRGLLAAVVAAAVVGNRGGDDRGHAEALAFLVLVAMQLGLAFAFRSERRTLFQLGVAGNPRLLAAVLGAALLQIAVQTVPALRAVFGLPALDAGDWWIALVASLLPVTAIECGKLLRHGRRRAR